jgi:hypothetical protein
MYTLTQLGLQSRLADLIVTWQLQTTLATNRDHIAFAQSLARSLL